MRPTPEQIQAELAEAAKRPAPTMPANLTEAEELQWLQQTIDRRRQELEISLNEHHPTT